MWSSQQSSYCITEELAALEHSIWNIVLNVAQHGPEGLLLLFDGVVDSWSLLSSRSTNVIEK